MSNISKTKKLTKKTKKLTKKTKTAKYDHAGRPALPKNQKRDKQISVHLSIEEMKEIEVAVHDRIVAEAAREILLNAAKRKNKRLAKKSA